MNTIYRWKDGARFSKLDAQEVGEELEAIAEENDGDLEPEHVVERARSKKSLLHGCFEWDNRKAAEAHRLTQARNLIRSVAVVFREADEDEEEKTTRAFEVVQRGTKRYRGVFSIMADHEQRQTLVRTALRELHSWRRRYSNLTELADVYEALDRVAKEPPAAE